jgi:tetratricopeptide (TPR) repeat protein
MTIAKVPFRRPLSALWAFAATALLAAPLAAQRGESGPMQEAAQLDRDGETTRARAIYQSVLDTTSDARAKAAVQRSMAMSYAFDGDCANTVKYEQMVIEYWKTQESVDPQNAFYQEGEMANEGARVCIDSDDLDAAEHWYREGYRMGLLEPEPRTHPKSLWDYRLAHALARIAAHRGNADEAQRHIAEARHALDSDPKMAEAQEQYFPYLVGYVALYTNDLVTAERELTKSMGLMQNDPFQVVLLGMTFEKKGDQAKATELYQKAFDMATGSNPPNVHSRAFTRKKLGK